MLSLQAFVDELEKIGVALNNKEQQRQAMQYTALGAAAAPVIRGVTHKIEHGSFMPAGASKGRWLGAHIVGGALAAGALPAARRALDRHNRAGAKARVQAGG